jgi:predicted amino acid-binding ACT domain protein
MPTHVSRVQYFYCTVRDRPGEAYGLLTRLAASGVNLLAFNAVPLGNEQTQLMLFPEDATPLARIAEGEGLQLDGPQHALLIRGDDELGALAEIHHDLADANVNVSAASGITAGGGHYGYIVYVASEDFSHAAAALGV